ncbi:CocE/NonD family hydrolase [Amycolatopsis sp. CA-230715]|uniref:CocE/NonD family hydrolase n=1 Tax=Amycolatopsis sp. CA-230715 TaxID=2745196 RepID=UPI001C02D75E|nr:CocE/NonD family hydrolase [Amycolatopsis sp. CA-230715]QWF83537.1 Cocaine esterase [Amycolatopsis sp. CA-230715]
MTSAFDRFMSRALHRAAEPLVRTRLVLMRDGVQLAADVYLPDDTGAPAPAIVTVTPYDRRNPGLIVDEARYYAAHGYAFVAVDTRGRGQSDGEWAAFVHDAEDTYDVIEWTAAQSWCDGAVGMTGLSYMGWVQWAAAALRPPHLRCLVSTSACGRWQQEIPYTNGVFQLFFVWWCWRLRGRAITSPSSDDPDWDKVLRHLPVGELGELLDLPGSTWPTLMAHDVLDEFWSRLRLDGRYQLIDVPCLHVTGWHDLEDLLGAMHHYERMVADSPAADRQRLLVGPWSHLKSRFPASQYAGEDLGEDAAVDMDAVHLRWFDHWLRGAENGVPAEPKVRVFELGSNRWRTADRWPLSTTDTLLHLGFDGAEGTLTATGRGGYRRFRYDPEDPVPTQFDLATYPVSDVALDQTEIERRPDVLTYTTEPLTEPLTVSGKPELQLNASTDGEDTDWHVKLTDVRPDGRSIQVTRGCLRAAHRDDPALPTALVPGQAYRFDLELWPTQHTFAAGHRIRVTVTSSDFPWFARNLNRFGPIATAIDPRIAVNTVYPSRLRLPTESPGAELGTQPPAEGPSDD